MRHPSLSFRLWYCTCEMTTKAAEETPAGTKVKATDTEDSAARTKEEPADTTGWVYKCSCGEEFETSIALGGDCSSYRSDKAHHKSLGFGPSRKAAARTPARTKLEVVDTARTKNEAADVEVDVIQANEESVDTTGWVYRCSCGDEFGSSIALGGHCSSYRSDKAHHKSLGFGPSRKAAERAASTKAADTDEPAELYISDKG